MTKPPGLRGTFCDVKQDTINRGEVWDQMELGRIVAPGWPVRLCDVRHRESGGLKTPGSKVTWMK